MGKKTQRSQQHVHPFVTQTFQCAAILQAHAYIMDVAHLLDVQKENSVCRRTLIARNKISVQKDVRRNTGVYNRNLARRRT